MSGHDESTETKLARVEGKLDQLLSGQKRINGSVRDHQKDIGSLKDRVGKAEVQLKNEIETRGSMMNPGKAMISMTSIFAALLAIAVLVLKFD